MEANLLLADSAQASPDGKVHALGLGWSQTSTPTPPCALVVVLGIPWDQTNRRIEFRLELLDTDGHAVPTPGHPQDAPLRVDGVVEAGRPAGLPLGSTVSQALALNMGPGIPLEPGQSYEWKLTIDDEHKENWSARFSVSR